MRGSVFRGALQRRASGSGRKVQYNLVDRGAPTRPKVRLFRHSSIKERMNPLQPFQGKVVIIANLNV